MAVTITRIRDRRGDLTIHRGGCADIKRAHRPAGPGDAPESYSGETLVDAIVAADRDMAGWFGETAYTESAERNGCWTVRTCDPAPCFAAIVAEAGISFDPDSGRPYLAVSFEPVLDVGPGNMTPDEEAASLRNGGVDNAGRYAGSVR